MRRLIANLQKFEPGIDGEQIADILWLAQYITITVPSESKAGSETESEAEADLANRQVGSADSTQENTNPGRESPSSNSEDTNADRDTANAGRETTNAEAYTAESVAPIESVDSTPRLPFRAAAPRALRKPIELERALRPLMRKVPSRSRYRLDEVATAEQIAETRMPMPVKLAERERWLDLALVVEETSLTEIWRKSIDEFQRLLEHLGAFRDVRVWTMRQRNSTPQETETLELFPRHRGRAAQRRVHSHQELIDPTQRRLILVLSDCTSVSWWEGKIHPWLQDWAAVNLVSVMQLLPQRMWERGILGEALPVQLRAQSPGPLNHQWQLEGLPVWRSEVPKSELTLPVVALEPEALGRWARAIAGFGAFPTAGVLFETDWQQDLAIPVLPSAPVLDELSPAAVAEQAQQWVAQFREDASPMARRLAVLMAAVPVDLAVVGLIQETVLKQEAKQVHVAEVYLGGLMQRVGERGKTRFEFKPGVRAELRKSLPKSEAWQLLEEVSGYIADRLGLPLRSLDALLMANLPEELKELEAEVFLPFAEIAIETLRQMGGNYAAFAEQVVQSRDLGNSESELLPPEDLSQPLWQTFEFEVVTVEVEAEAEGTSNARPEITLEPFRFEMATLEQRKTGLFRRTTEWVIQRQSKQAQQFIEQLTESVALEMVAIPAGEFLMGSPPEEPERLNTEGPQHRVTIPAFYLGKYPITQAQWRVVAGLPQVEQALDPDPSRFKGDDRPVEQVSWDDAVEFCARLRELTGRDYRLPSEAEWEYACRAGTTTPFHFGETITPELANYRWSETYGEIKITKPKDFEGTTPVRQFEAANAFGLYDMHGNVWEWCADHWHRNYEGAPTDGSAWLSDQESSARVWRGGSWDSFPEFCRSAYRIYIPRVGRIDDLLGFRVSCSAASVN